MNLILYNTTIFPCSKRMMYYNNMYLPLERKLLISTIYNVYNTSLSGGCVILVLLLSVGVETVSESTALFCFSVRDLT